MEDRVDLEVVRNADGDIEYLFVAIYDGRANRAAPALICPNKTLGHGGFQASEYASKHLHQNIKASSAFSWTHARDNHV